MEKLELQYTNMRRQSFHDRAGAGNPSYFLAQNNYRSINITRVLEHAWWGFSTIATHLIISQASCIHKRQNWEILAWKSGHFVLVAGASLSRGFLAKRLSGSWTGAKTDGRQRHSCGAGSVPPPSIFNQQAGTCLIPIANLSIFPWRRGGRDSLGVSRAP